MKMKSIFCRRALLSSIAVFGITGMRQAALGMGSSPNQVSPPAKQARFRGIGTILFVDAVEGAKLLGVEFYADQLKDPFYSSSTVWKINRETLVMPISPIPEVVRIVWRDSSELVRRTDDLSKTTYEGNILGDHKVVVASRIPDDVLKEIRKSGGGLRLKFRLKTDGVLFAWDIERFGGGLPRHSMPGGDF
jgi:hypothetical protein